MIAPQGFALFYGVIMINPNPNPGVVFKPLSDEQYEIERLTYLLKRTEVSLAETEEYYDRFIKKIMLMLAALIVYSIGVFLFV